MTAKKKRPANPDHLITGPTALAWVAGRGRSIKGEYVLVDGEMGGHSWPYLWIGEADGACLAILDWPELERIAMVVAAKKRRPSR